MSQYQGDEMDHVVDDYEIAEVDDDVYFHGRFMADSESEDDDDDDEYDHLVCSIHTSVSTFFFFFFAINVEWVFCCPLHHLALLLLM
jgi:hypothetical protein